LAVFLPFCLSTSSIAREEHSNQYSAKHEFKHKTYQNAFPLEKENDEVKRLFFLKAVLGLERIKVIWFE
jgi:hypothetical protein